MLPIIFVGSVAALLRIFLINRDSVLFAYDMGRDLLWAKDIVFYQTPTLIGPAASIWGVYFGPLWFYFLAIPLYIWGAHPLSAVYMTALTITVTGILAFFLFRKYLGNTSALVLAILILTNSTLINISTFAFHANVLPLLTLLLIYFCYLAVIKKPIYLAGAFLSASFMFHADPAPAVVSTFIPIAIALVFKLYKLKNFKKTILISMAAYAIPFVPQILFELRNNFIQTKSLIAYFLGENPSLSGQLPFAQRIANRTDLFFDFFKKSFTAQINLLAVISLILIVIGLINFFRKSNDQNLKKLAKICLIAIALTFFLFAFLVTVEVKDWYLYGMPVIFSLLITFALIPFKKYKLATVAFIIFFILLNVTPFLKSSRSLAIRKDPALLANQLRAIDAIYEDAQKEQFSVYTFTPSIYDHNYQYLFWWQGQKLNKGLPQDFAYLPNQPDYVRNKNFYEKNKEQTSLTYLIIENAPENEFYTRNEWLKNFADYQLVWEKDINNAITLQKRQK